MNSILKKELPNGVRLLMEPIGHVRSASAGLWLDVGSRDESEDLGGICHFIEHMFFKGSSERGALELADEMNRLGGHFNAFTSQEMICLHARLIDERLEAGLDLLAEILLSATFPDEELQRERNVILEECKMIEDSPEELVGDMFFEALWGEHPVGRPIIGTLETIGSFQRDGLLEFAGREFTPQRLIVAVAGAFDPKQVERQAERLFGPLEPGNGARRRNGAPTGAYLEKRREKDIEQAQFCFGALGPHRLDEDRYAFALLNIIIGGGMSSRVFKEVREKRGLAYSIGSYQTSFRDTGGFSIGGGTSPEHLEQVVELCAHEITDLYTNGAKADELDLAKQQLRTSVLFALESTGARMNRLAEQELYYGRFYPVDDLLRKIEAVTLSDIQDVAQSRLQNAPVAAAAVVPPGTVMVQLNTL